MLPFVKNLKSRLGRVHNPFGLGHTTKNGKINFSLIFGPSHLFFTLYFTM
jgi:hypothetical protein